MPNFHLDISENLLFTCCMINPSIDSSHVLDYIHSSNNLYFKKVYLELYNVYTENNIPYLTISDDPAPSLVLIMESLNYLLKVSEFDLFEKCLYNLNKINSKDILLYLAKLYYENGFKDMATKTILRSIKELDAIDHECLDILAHEI